MASMDQDSGPRQRKKRVLFLCQNNSVLSQMAEGILRARSGHIFEVFSAGVRPRPIHPLTHHVMKEIGVDIGEQRPKGIEDLNGRAPFLFLFALCSASESEFSGVAIPAGMKVNWLFNDPDVLSVAGDSLQAFRRLRDAIEQRIDDWLRHELPAEWFTPEIPRKRTVLIVCPENSCRSQMAEGLWRVSGGEAWDVHSGGSRPAGFVHPHAIAVMREVGIDIASQRSKSLAELAGLRPDLVITVCESARVECQFPVVAGQVLHWQVDDPVAERGEESVRLRVFRAARDELARLINEYLASPVKAS
jgi:arsenate reductase